MSFHVGLDQTEEVDERMKERESLSREFGKWEVIHGVTAESLTSHATRWVKQNKIRNFHQLRIKGITGAT